MQRTFRLIGFRPSGANVLAIVALAGTAALMTGAFVKASFGVRAGTAVAPVTSPGVAVPRDAGFPLARRLDPGMAYPAEVIRVIDGDTFEARVRVWPGLDVDTKVRLRGIDAAELHARCPSELAQAQAARAALEKILSEGDVTIAHVGIDKYGGRVDATIATRGTADVSAALLNGGFARAYGGGRRGGWCG